MHLSTNKTKMTPPAIAGLYLVEAWTNNTIDMWICKNKREAISLAAGIRKRTNLGFATRKVCIYSSPKPTIDDHPDLFAIWDIQPIHDIASGRLLRKSWRLFFHADKGGTQ